MVTLQNYEEYIMLYVDEELDVASVKALMDFLDEHPELKKELELYQKTKLPVEDELFFAGKEQLFKKPVRTISVNRWMLYGIAAGLLLLIGLATIKWNNKPENTIIQTPEIANNKIDSVIPASQHTAKVDTQIAPSPTINLIEEKPLQPLAKTKTRTPVNHNEEKQKPSMQQPVKVPEKPSVIEQEEAVQIAKREEEHEKQVDMKIEEEMAIQIEESSTDTKAKTKKGLLALLPISSEKKQGLTHLKNTMEGKVETVKNLQEELKNTSFEVRLGNKELFVINL